MVPGLHDHDIIFVPYDDDYSVEIALECEQDSPFALRGLFAVL